ncbi:glycine hydroxymethyltransferase [Actinomyces johnsonii F0542]|uniref:Serine hydroxymethyltransferase n=2 Tax=Actinomyces johnsonii TaxID=544581 RepID=U1QSP8_9ACTO|nr:glycine hydroxymethyltransferase [Actinomyces johnsonii F0542]
MSVATGAGWITTGERHEHDSGVARLGRGSPTSARTAACHGTACAPHPRRDMTAQAVTPSLNQPLAELDPDIAEVLTGELARQRETLEMIASENFVPRAVLECQGSVLTNKYAEGYPGRRYYGGCEVVDVAESLAIERAKAVFDAEWANVQPHSGAQANAAVLHALATPGDTLLGLSLAHGGHLTHGMKINFSGKNYNATAYGVDETTMRIEMDQVREAALRERPTVIIAGWSAYPRHLDFAAFRAIADEVGAALWVDMAHFAGLVAAGLHPNPVPHADVVSTTVHKTLGGPRSGMLLSSRAEQWGKKLNSAVFPGQQGGPLMHVIAAKAVAMKIAGTEEFRERQERTVRGAAIIAERLGADDVKAAGVSLVTGGTDVHLVLVDLRDSSLDGQQAEDLLHTAGITVNRNAVPFDPRPPRVTSGLRIGTPALATRGFGDAEFTEVADIIAATLIHGAAGTADDETLAALRGRVRALTDAFPLYPGLAQ